MRKLREVSGHSADYLLFGLDDSCIDKTKKLLKQYSENDIIFALEALEDLALIIKKR